MPFAFIFGLGLAEIAVVLAGFACVGVPSLIVGYAIGATIFRKKQCPHCSKDL